MKKVIALLLCLCLLVSTGISAAAALISSDSALNERLKAITLSVKETLSIGDAFTSFDGKLNENTAASLWSLSWSSDKESIYVLANENGRIVSFNHYRTGENTRSSGYIPRFPSITLDEAKTIAKTFLNKVLDTKLEAVDLRGNSNLDYSGSAQFYLNGSMKIYDIETPVNISMNIMASTKEVSSFYRSDYGQEYSGVAKPSEAADKAAAAAALKGTLNMKMAYALPGDGTHTARLQYTPNPDGSYVVDAVTGKLVDLSKLDYSDSSQNDMMKGASPSTSAVPDEGGLTTVEQETVDKLQGVLSQSDLENTVRAYTELGLTGDFKLQNVNYYTYEDENKQTQVLASIGFAYSPKDDTAQYRYISMDAKTGKLISVSSNRIFVDAAEKTVTLKYSSTQTEATARSFAGKIMPDELKQTDVTVTGPSENDSTQNYSFYRTHENIAFPENYINVGVDAGTGFVVSFYSNWYKYDVTFVSPDGAISAGIAADKYSAGIGTTLKYVAVPTTYQPSGLMLSYTSGETSVWGVDAISGELLKGTVTPEQGLQYSDLAGNPYAEKIRQLAAYGVGFPGGAFKPDSKLTQEDALVIITSTNGRKVIPLMTSDNMDDLYNTAYAMGILTASEKDPAKLISRVEFVKYLINAMGYKDIAQLPGIFKAGFRDDTSIPEGLMGYVAIARGTGIVNGDQNGRFNPNDISTRALAAVMVYNCLNRK